MAEGGGGTGTGGSGRDGRRPNANYRYFGTVLFLGALGMILLMVLLNR